LSSVVYYVKTFAHIMIVYTCSAYNQENYSEASFSYGTRLQQQNLTSHSCIHINLITSFLNR